GWGGRVVGWGVKGRGVEGGAEPAADHHPVPALPGGHRGRAAPARADHGRQRAGQGALPGARTGGAEVDGPLRCWPGGATPRNPPVTCGPCDFVAGALAPCPGGRPPRTPPWPPAPPTARPRPSP